MSGSSNDSNSYDTTIEEDYEGGGVYMYIRSNNKQGED
jgi:hypothetical protein